MLWEWANQRSSVYILDIDGTLMPSAEIDNLCFWQAVFACFGDRDSLPDLHNFRHVTDTGILNEWCVLELGRPPRPDEIVKIKQDFLQLLESAAVQNPEHFSPLPGVIEWLQAVSQNSTVYAGIATGGWEHSARLKLRLAGLDRFQLTVASSDDAEARAEIMQIAANQSLTQHDDVESGITYVGDGLWDLQASQSLGWNFIGIASGEQAGQLSKAGATRIQADFRQTS